MPLPSRLPGLPSINPGNIDAAPPGGVSQPGLWVSQSVWFNVGNANCLRSTQVPLFDSLWRRGTCMGDEHQVTSLGIPYTGEPLLTQCVTATISRLRTPIRLLSFS